MIQAVDQRSYLHFSPHSAMRVSRGASFLPLQARLPRCSLSAHHERLPQAILRQDPNEIVRCDAANALPGLETLRRRDDRVWANVSGTIHVDLAAILAGELLNEHQRTCTRTNRMRSLRSKMHGGSLPNVKRSVLFGLQTHLSGAVCTRREDCQCCKQIDGDGPRNDSVIVTLRHNHQTFEPVLSLLSRRRTRQM